MSESNLHPLDNIKTSCSFLCNIFSIGNIHMNFFNQILSLFWLILLTLLDVMLHISLVTRNAGLLDEYLLTLQSFLDLLMMSIEKKTNDLNNTVKAEMLQATKVLCFVSVGFQHASDLFLAAIFCLFFHFLEILLAYERTDV